MKNPSKQDMKEENRTFMTKTKGVHYNIASYIHVDEQTSKLQKGSIQERQIYNTKSDFDLWKLHQTSSTGR